MAMVALNVLSLLFVHGALPKKSTVCVALYSLVFLQDSVQFVKFRSSSMIIVYMLDRPFCR